MNPLGISDEEFRKLAEQHRRKNFLSACRIPGMWLDRAMLHKRGADVVYETAFAASERNFARRAEGKLRDQELEDFQDQRLLGEYLLLAGYAFECVLKGYLLAIDPELVREETGLHRRLRTHRLFDLCRQCSIALSAEEEGLMRLITRHIEWGKYPAPLVMSDMPSWVDSEDQKDKSLAVGNAFVERRMQLLVDGVFTRAAVKLDEERIKWRIAEAAGRGVTVDRDGQQPSDPQALNRGVAVSAFAATATIQTADG